jgi:hypothetical protein
VFVVLAPAARLCRGKAERQQVAGRDPARGHVVFGQFHAAGHVAVGDHEHLVRLQGEHRALRGQKHKDAAGDDQER